MKGVYIKNSRSGTTLMEMMIAASLTGIMLAGVYLLWANMAKTWITEGVKIGLNQDMQVAISQIKKEIRLSSGSDIFYYPSGSPPYTAVSLPLAVDDDNDNLIELDANDNIIWDKTVIYHTYTVSGVKQLRKTIFDPRDTGLTAAERGEQLSYVVSNGEGSGTHNGINAATKVLFDNLETFEIDPAVVTYDSYSIVLDRTDFVQFGSVLLDSGSHILRFEVTDKNAVSSDYHFAIDTVTLTPSGGIREAEELLPPYGSSGQVASNVDLSAVGSWSGHAHLLYEAVNVGDYVELEIYNDEWIETNFDDSLAEHDGTSFEFDDSLATPEVVLRLEGMTETWEAEFPTQGGMSTPYNESPPDLPSLSGVTMRTIVTSDSIQTKGERSRVLFRAHPTTNNFEIVSAYIEERTTGQNGDSGTKQQIYFSNTPVTIGTTQTMEDGAIGFGAANIVLPAGFEVYSNWIDMPIDPDKDYLVSYYISSTAGNASPSYFPGPEGVTNSYYQSGDQANNSTWGTSGTAFRHIVGMVDIQVTHPATGVWDGQIYDTKLDDPEYEFIAWTADEPALTDITFYFRSSDDEEFLDDPPWQTFTGSPGVISATSRGRYIQVRAQLTAQAPYFVTPKVKRFNVRWPGAQTVIDIGGYFSRNSDQGIIKLTVDGQELSKSLTVNLKAAQEYLQREFTSTVSSEIEPRNTPQ